MANTQKTKPSRKMRKTKSAIETKTPPFETKALRRELRRFFEQQVADPITGGELRVGNYRYGVYAFFDYDGEPIYVGQTKEQLRTRIQRHLTNQRTDAVAMKVLDPFEVFEVAVWPLPQYQDVPLRPKNDEEKRLKKDAQRCLDWLEATIFRKLRSSALFKEVLNEKIPPEIPDQDQYSVPPSWRGKVIDESVFEIRSHPDTRIARRSETLSSLARVISERQVSKGLRRTFLTQAKRLAWLAQKRLQAFANLPEGSEIKDER